MCGMIFGGGFRNDLNLSLEGNKFSWGNGGVCDVNENFFDVISVVVYYNAIFPDNVVKFVFDGSNVDLPGEVIKDSLIKLVKLNKSVGGQIWIKKDKNGKITAFYF